MASLSKKAIEWILSTLAEINWRFLLWLDRIEAGKTTSEIASRAGVTTRQVQRGAKRARDWYEHRSLPRFKFIWPEGMLSPHSACRHGEIPRGARVYCPVCHKTGCDHWRALNPRIGPPPTAKGVADQKLSAAEIAASVQSGGKRTFKPKIRKPKKTAPS